MNVLKIAIRPTGTNLLLTNGVQSLGLGSQRIAKPLVSLQPVLSCQTPVRSKGTKTDVDDAVKVYKKGSADRFTPDPNCMHHFAGGRDVKLATASQGETSLQLSGTHFSVTEDCAGSTGDDYHLAHPIWDEAQTQGVQITHRPVEDRVDKLAYIHIQVLKQVFDLFSGFKFGVRTEKKWLNRISFLETVAAVPGMVGAMMRHLQSLRYMRKDCGWIHTLLGEAENERLHLLTALELRQPSLLFRVTVIVTQALFVTWFSLCYIISPRFCHRLVGYLEEEAVKTYTLCLEDIEVGSMKHWNCQTAPGIAIRYWKLKPDGTMKDVILAIRADEAHHRIVNHTLASLKLTQANPYKLGE